MNKLTRQLLSIVILFIVLAIIFAFTPTVLKNSPKNISLSEAINLIKDNRIKQVIISGSKITLTTSDNIIYQTESDPNTSFIDLLDKFNIPKDNLTNLSISYKSDNGWAFWLNLLLPIVLPFIIVFIFFSSLFKKSNQNAMQIFSFSRSNIKLFSPDKDVVTFKDVAGLKEAKEELQEIVEFLKNPKKFQDLGARIPRGVLLMGAPGSGKTLLARAVAGEAHVPFFHISGSEFVEMFVGVGAGRVRDAFGIAKKAAPSILFIDEIDAIGRERGAGIGGGQDEREQTLNQILVEMDGFDRDTRVIVMAATNRPDILDPALLRPGRFDRRIILDLPDINEREEILKIHSRDKKLNSNVNLREIAERTPGFSGADLANLINEAAILAARYNQKNISQDNLLNAIEKVMLGPERKSRVINQKEKEITAFHEAGHAMLSLLIPGSSELKKVSIVTRGQAGGYTLRLPTEERYLKTRSEFLADITTLLGGYITEELVFHDVSTGASNDLKEATDLARALVTRYGMSTKLGPMTFGKTEDLVFLGKEITTEKNYSEQTAVLIDQEVRNIISSCYKKGKQLLKENLDKVEKISKALLEKETLEKYEIEELLK